MADISQVKLPDNSVYDINDATARSGLNDKMDKANPTGTGALSINRKASTTVGTNSTTLGNDGTASGTNSIAEGWLSVASGTSSHAEGSRSEASNTSAHAEGTQTVASGSASHSEGSNTVASGNYGSHAEGAQTTASGDCSHAEGYKTTANRLSQHVFGEWNVVDTAGADGTVRGNYVEIVGNGTASSARSNARTLDWQGNETLAGDLIYNGDTSLTNKLIYEKTVSGSIASFTDGGNNIPCKSVKAQIVATQAGTGTPSPSNVRAISGWSSVDVSVCGINQWDEQWEAGSLNWNDGSPDNINLDYIRAKNYIPVKPSTTYYIVVGSKGLTVYTYGIDKSFKRRVINGSTSVLLQINADEYFIRFRTASQTTTYANDISINYPSTDTTYHAHQGTTHTITLPETIYGGELECVGGSGKKTFEKANMEDISWTYFSASNLFYVENYGNKDNGEILCEMYQTTNLGYRNMPDKSITTNKDMFGTRSVIIIKDTSITSVQDFITAVTGKKIVYELATPTTFTTTPESIPTLSGVNNIYADSGDVEVTYFTSNADDLADAIRAEINKEICHAPTVTPSGSDKLLIVQSQGQGLATLDNVVGVKMDKSNPTGTGSLSLNRKSGTTTGTNSVAIGLDCTASGAYSTAEGLSCTASGARSFAAGDFTTASGDTAVANGTATISNHRAQFVFGQYNKADTSTADANQRGNYVEIVGNGTSGGSRSNARTLDWSGNEVLAGGLKINGNRDVSSAMGIIAPVGTTYTTLRAYLLTLGVGLHQFAFYTGSEINDLPTAAQGNWFHTCLYLNPRDDDARYAYLLMFYPTNTFVGSWSDASRTSLVWKKITMTSA